MNGGEKKAHMHVLQLAVLRLMTCHFVLAGTLLKRVRNAVDIVLAVIENVHEIPPQIIRLSPIQTWSRDRVLR